MRFALPLLVAAVTAACAPPQGSGGPLTDPWDGGPAFDSGSPYQLGYATRPIGPCEVFPRDTFFHADIRSLPVHPRSSEWIAYLGPDSTFRLPTVPDTSNPFATVRYGTPINRADSNTPRTVVAYDGFYPVEKQYAGPMPHPDPLEIQDGFDQHTIILETDECASYELIGASNFFKVLRANGGARWDLSTHDFLPDAHAVTAPGFPLVALKVRAEEVRWGRIDHALVFVIPMVRQSEPMWPAQRSDGRSTDPNAIPMGAWLRLKADFDLSPLPQSVRVVAEALQRHGAILGDTGGVEDGLNAGIEKTTQFTDATGRNIEAELASIRQFVKASDFEVVDPTPMQVAPDSLRIR